MMLRPSPEPRSITKSCGVTFAMSSIFSTVTNGVGTHTTSLPDWPTTGSNGFFSCATDDGGDEGETQDDERLQHATKGFQAEPPGQGWVRHWDGIDDDGITAADRRLFLIPQTISTLRYGR